MSWAGYRHKDGLFPPIHTAFDHCPVAHFIRFTEHGTLVRSGVDGVDYLNHGGAETTKAEAERLALNGSWRSFDPDLKSNWNSVVVGAIGAPQIRTTEGDEPIPVGFFSTWPQAQAAREDQINEQEGLDVTRHERPHMQVLPEFFITRAGLFGDGEHGPYWASVENGELVCHGLNGQQHRLAHMEFFIDGAASWKDWALNNLKTGQFVAFDPESPDDWKKVVSSGGPAEITIDTAQGPLAWSDVPWGAGSIHLPIALGQVLKLQAEDMLASVRQELAA